MLNNIQFQSNDRVLKNSTSVCEFCLNSSPESGSNKMAYLYVRKSWSGGFIFCSAWTAASSNPQTSESTETVDVLSFLT